MFLRLSTKQKARWQQQDTPSVLRKELIQVRAPILHVQHAPKGVATVVGSAVCV